MKFEKIENIALAFTAVFSMLLAGAAVVSIIMLAALLSEFAVVPLHAQTRPAVELQAAMTKEQVDGDLKTAIEAYQKIAADKSAPRDVRAKSLLHLAGCYEKLGQQAQSVYQQIVRDFGDQPAAAQAKVRLAALKQDDHPPAPATMTQRKIELPIPNRGIIGPGDTDGHRLIYENGATGELIYGDLAGNNKRVIFKAKPDDLPGWSPSKDFSMVFLRLHSKPGEPQILAVLNTDGTGYREIAKLDARPYCWPTWSWDNRYLLCAQSKDDTSRLLRISVADGQTRDLLSLKAAKVTAVNFSPDGRLVAYQAQPSSAANPVSQIFVMPAEGGAPQLVYEERLTSTRPSLKLLDWTADGRYLAIASERTGKGALHLLPIKDGQSAGALVFVRVGDFDQGATTAAGGLIYRSVEPGGAWAVYVASLDANSRPGGWKRLDLPLGNTLNPAPQWSGDSNQIVYSAQYEDVGQTGGESIRLRNLSTGGDREIYHALGYTHCTWAAQQPKLFCTENGMGKADIFSIAVDSGQVDRLQTLPGSPVYGPLSSRDGQALYMFRGDYVREGELLRWEIASQRETVLERIPPGAWGWVSRDERWVIEVAEHRNVKIRPTSGGDWKPLLSDSHAGHFNLTPDGNWLIYHTVDSAGKHGLFRVSTAGGQPERLGDFPTNTPDGSLEISPDGRKVLVAAGEYDTVYELWSLENFVPPVPKP
jgi:Tol biopolymer transport system component